MKKALILAVLGLGVLVLIPVIWFFTGYGTLIADEEGIRAQTKVIDLSIDKMEKKITGKGFVVKDFRNTLLEVMGKTIGEGGRAAGAGKVFNAVSERYPDVPKDLWLDLSQTMGAEYESTYNAQTSQQSRIQSYRLHLRQPGCWLAKKLGGFPTINLEEEGKLIIGGTARDARQTGTIEAVDPFADKKK